MRFWWIIAGLVVIVSTFVIVSLGESNILDPPNSTNLPSLHDSFVLMRMLALAGGGTMILVGIFSRSKNDK